MLTFPVVRDTANAEIAAPPLYLDITKSLLPLKDHALAWPESKKYVLSTELLAYVKVCRGVLIALLADKTPVPETVTILLIPLYHENELLELGTLYHRS